MLLALALTFLNQWPSLAQRSSSQWQKYEKKILKIQMCIFYYSSACIWMYQVRSLPTFWHQICSYHQELKLKDKTRNIKRTQTPPRLWMLTLTCDLGHTSRSRELMSLEVAHCIVPWYHMMSVHVKVYEIWLFVHFCVTFDPSRTSGPSGKSINFLLYAFFLRCWLPPSTCWWF